ncbi:toprim domain-containing protein [Shewanella sp. SG44-6]|nr:toprim domain-containing protein [Shewanella sp. SG44-6]
MSASEKIIAVKNMVDPFVLYGRIPEMSAALKSMPSQVPDPVTGSGTTVFRVKTNGDCYLNGTGYMDAIDVVAYIYRLTKMQAVDKVVELYSGGWQYVSNVKLETIPKKRDFSLSDDDIKKRKSFLRSMHKASVEGKNSQEVCRYLAYRGLNPDLLPPSIRGISKALHYTKGKDSSPVKTYWPAMLPIYHNAEGKPISFHRIYLNLNGEGKAPVDVCKKIMAPTGDMRGGAIRLDEPTIYHDEAGPFGCLALAEGVETSLAVREATGLPTWACYSNTLLEQVVIPKGITQVKIYADKDKANDKGVKPGEDSAMKLMKRLISEGIDCEVLLPPLDIPEGSKGVDWLDVLNELGTRAFRFKASAAIDVRK